MSGLELMGRSGYRIRNGDSGSIRTSCLVGCASAC